MTTRETRDARRETQRNARFGLYTCCIIFSEGRERAVAFSLPLVRQTDRQDKTRQPTTICSTPNAQCFPLYSSQASISHPPSATFPPPISGPRMHMPRLLRYFATGTTAHLIRPYPPVRLFHLRPFAPVPCPPLPRPPLLHLYMSSTSDTRRLAASTTICIHLFPWSHAWHAMFRIRPPGVFHTYVIYALNVPPPHQRHAPRRESGIESVCIIPCTPALGVPRHSAG